MINKSNNNKAIAKILMEQIQIYIMKAKGILYMIP